MAIDSHIEKSDVTVGMKFGCLQVLDEGEEYLQVMSEFFFNVKQEKENFVKASEEGKYKCKDHYGWNGGETVITPAYEYKPVNFEVHGESVTVSDFDKAIANLIIDKKIKHYKCKCRKCGKIRYYSAETLQTEPRVCCKPIYCSSKCTYSVRANNANYNKKKKYENDESVCLVNDKNDVVPADKYCDSWNEKRKKELIKQAEKDAQIIAAIPRKKAVNYDIDYVGLRYESFDVLECVNVAHESIPIPYYNQRHQKKYRDIIVYKEYLCKCYICGKEKKVTCDKFGIYPPTEHGYNAYAGYWSAIFCDCHRISSFQWIVNDILIKHRIDYKVEVTADGLYGIDNGTPLRFDFAVYKEGKLVAFIECQGEQHFMPIEEFGGERRFVIQQRNDEEKRKYAKVKDIKLIEISYKDKKYDKVESILRDEHII